MTTLIVLTLLALLLFPSVFAQEVATQNEQQAHDDDTRELAPVDLQSALDAIRMGERGRMSFQSLQRQRITSLPRPGSPISSGTRQQGGDVPSGMIDLGMAGGTRQLEDTEAAIDEAPRLLNEAVAPENDADEIDPTEDELRELFGGGGGPVDLQTALQNIRMGDRGRMRIDRLRNERITALPSSPVADQIRIGTRQGGASTGTGTYSAQDLASMIRSSRMQAMQNAASAMRAAAGGGGGGGSRQLEETESEPAAVEAPADGMGDEEPRELQVDMTAALNRIRGGDRMSLDRMRNARITSLPQGGQRVPPMGTPTSGGRRLRGDAAQETEEEQ
ncbi:unnamed protein product [Vitrella brassicaformis CCMP3155]|uniref:Secreted protein n=2 Tax=Vitrella brassicaformis TaxID=1169539 RepID=A0A0G4F4R3_VITBC|nr:unnamed protein product [Vitrella brassicaformis CCMP3155]|mmetsp:Transcript_14602/g.34801  ORF Transcript_14602/g.34801 Transcript_14602/m.34801 type:complete len:333 (+) Transcript_14602:2273-3271(+)|eukprot:CEM06919.1 unnamed protein product [Vitrella brassicaformis CCMP3155]